MSRRDKAVIDQLLNRIWDLEEALELLEAMLEAHDLSKAELPEFWRKIEGRKQ